MKTIDQLIQGIEDTTIEYKDLSGFELFVLCKTKLLKTAAQEARRRLEAKGLKRTPYGWLSPRDIGTLGVVFKNGAWTQPTREAFKLWIDRLKQEREAAYAERTNAVQATLKIGP